MITSNEVNALMMQQQQQQSMLGMGAPQAVVGASQYPPQFNFGANSYLSGTMSSGGGPTSMMASGVSGVGSALGVAGMASGFLPASMTGMFGSGLMGSAMGFAGINPLGVGIGAAAAGVGAIGSSMNNGLRMNNQVGQMLSSANFANPNAPGGFGFGFGDQARMTSTVLGMGAANPFVGQQDQMQMLNQFQQMGLDKGVTSMGKMIEKFKEFSKTTEDVATQLGKTVTEVTGLVQNLRGSGFYSAAEVTGMSSKMSASASYGINMQQQQQMMQSMAQQARGSGLTGASGATLGVNLAQAFGSANQMGFIDENTLLDITQTTNTADASQAMAQSLGGRFSNAMTQGGMLENILGGFTKVGKDGQLQLDNAAMNSMAGGGMSFGQLRGRTSDLISNNRAAFTTNKRKLASDFLSSEQGMGAILGTFGSMAKDRAQGGDITEKEAFKLLMKEYQIADERQADMLFDMSQHADSIVSNNLQNRVETLAAEKRRAYINKHRSFTGMKAKMSSELGKLTNNASIGSATANINSNIDAGVNSLERAFFGIEDSTAGLYTKSSGSEFRDSFLMGDLDYLGSDLSQTKANTGQAFNMKTHEMETTTLASSAATAARIQSLSGGAYSAAGRKAFTSELGKGIDTKALSGIDLSNTSMGETGFLRSAADIFGLVDPMAEFQKETTYGGPQGRDAEFFLSNYGFGSGGVTDDVALYRNLMNNAKRQAADKLGKPISEVTEQEAQFVIASQGGKSSAALQRYMGRHKQGGQELSHNLQDDFLSKAGGGGSVFGATVASHVTAFGTVGAVGAGATSFGIGTGLGATLGAGVGAITGTIHGLYKEGKRSEFEAQLKGSAGALLAKINSKGKLRKFDQKMQQAMLDNPGDREAAMQKVAKEMSEELGEAVSAEDVGAALKAMYRASGEKTFDDRLSSNNYKGALGLTGAASRYQTAEMAKGNLGVLRDSLMDEDVEGIDRLQVALSSSGDDMVASSREEMLNIARKAAVGEFKYDGDNEILKQLAGAGELSDELSQFAGKELSSLDKAYGEGAGARLRKLAGVRQGGMLGKKELKEMAAKLAVSDSLRVTEGGAKASAVDPSGVGDDEILTATANLVNSTQTLAVYVDNIASVLTGNETAGQKIPGINKVDKT